MEKVMFNEKSEAALDSTLLEIHRLTFKSKISSGYRNKKSLLEKVLENRGFLERSILFRNNR